MPIRRKGSPNSDLIGRGPGEKDAKSPDVAAHGRGPGLIRGPKAVLATGLGKRGRADGHEAGPVARPAERWRSQERRLVAPPKEAGGVGIAADETGIVIPRVGADLDAASPA